MQHSAMQSTQLFRLNNIDLTCCVCNSRFKLSSTNMFEDAHHNMPHQPLHWCTAKRYPNCTPAHTTAHHCTIAHACGNAIAETFTKASSKTHCTSTCPQTAQWLQFSCMHTELNESVIKATSCVCDCTGQLCVSQASSLTHAVKMQWLVRDHSTP